MLWGSTTVSHRFLNADAKMLGWNDLLNSPENWKTAWFRSISETVSIQQTGQSPMEE
jgi:hypothetical protein